jgi:hypothetical protein
VLKAQDVEKAWSTATEGDHGNVGLVLFTIGTPYGTHMNES